MYVQEDRFKQVYQVLQDLGVINILQNYSPTLAGTVPLGIDIPGSDLDIICEVYNLQDFQELVITVFGEMKDFKS